MTGALLGNMPHPLCPGMWWWWGRGESSIPARKLEIEAIKHPQEKTDPLGAPILLAGEGADEDTGRDIYLRNF